MHKCEIQLDKENSKEAYYPGDTVSGSLVCELSRPENFTKISIHFEGRAYVYWTESHNKKTVEYTSTDSFINKEVVLWESKESCNAHLPSGQHNWPFTFTIPPRAVSCLEDTNGNIRYILMGKFWTKKKSHAIASVAETRLSVLQLVKVTDPHLFQPLRKEVQKTLCCLACTSSPITLTIAFPKTGFLLGEMIQFHVSVENGTTRQLTLSARLKQRIVLHAGGKTREDVKALVKARGGAVLRQMTRDWDAALEVPTAGVQIIHDSSCSNIKVFHYVKITCHIPIAWAFSIAVPVQLGNCAGESD